MLAIGKARDYAASIGKKFSVPFVVYHQGETNVIYQVETGLTSDIYQGYLEMLSSQFYNALIALTGQKIFPKWFIVQESFPDLGPDRNMVVKQGQYQVNSQTLIPVYPAYQLSALTGSGHYDTFSILRWTETTAKNIFENMENKKDYVFNVTGIEPNGNNLLLSFNVPVQPIQFDSSRGYTPAMGFSVSDLSLVDNPITNVQAVGANKILLTCTNPIAPGFVYYQNYSPADVNVRPGSSVMDSDTTISRSAITLSNYLLSFKLQFGV